MAAGDSWQTTCIACCPDESGHTYVLVVVSDGENFQSYVFRVRDFQTAQRNLIYEVSAWLTSLWRSPSGRLYAVDNDGRLHSDEAGTWQVNDLACPAGLTWVWGLDDDRLFACGRRGAVARRLGGRWERFDDGVDGHLYGMDGTDGDDLYVVGEAGRIFHYDGSAWLRIDPPTNHILNAVRCRTPDAVYVCGEGGMLFEGARSRWRRITGADSNLFALELFRDLLYVGGGPGGIFTYDGTSVAAGNTKVAAFNLFASSKFLGGAGNDMAYLYDGSSWLGSRFG